MSTSESFASIARQNSELAKYLPAVAKAMWEQGIHSRAQLWEEKVEPLIAQAPEFFEGVNYDLMRSYLQGNTPAWNKENREFSPTAFAIAGALDKGIEELFEIGNIDIPLHPSRFTKGHAYNELGDNNDDRTMGPLAAMLRTDRTDLVKEALLDLPPFAERVLRLSFGFYSSQTSDEIANDLNFHRLRISDVQSNALLRLRHSRLKVELRASLTDNEPHWEI